MRKLVLKSCGFLFLTFGGIGIFIPVLPTTPFVLLAAGCFASSDKIICEKLKSTRYLGEYIKNYQNKSGVKKSTKIISLIFLWSSLFLSIILVKIVFIKIILIFIGLCVTLHIMLLKKRNHEVTILSEIDRK